MFASPAYAQAANAAGPGGLLVALNSYAPFIAVFAIFYFLMIRPQQKRAKDHRALIGAAKKGDEVVTGGGIVGKITRVMDDELEIEVAPTVKLRVVKGTLMEVRSKTMPAAANDTKN